MTTEADRLLELKQTIDDALSVHLASDSSIAPGLIRAMRYAALGDGKRLRPLLVVCTSLALRGRLADALAPAAAVEYVHAYSLIHDDLPAMDNDELRHGLPSCHVRFGEANAILAGDALQSHAFDVLANAPGVSNKKRLALVALLAEAIGAGGMAGGQHFDMASEQRSLSLTELQNLHAAKTGALISASVRMGAVLGRTSAEQEVLLREFGQRIGLAFQIVDDILDVTQSTAELGKPAGSDEKAGKSTFVTLLGVNEARRMADELLDEAQKMLARAGLQRSLLPELAKRAVHRTV